MLVTAASVLKGMAADHGNLDIVYRTRGDLDEAEGMHKKALALRKALGIKEGMARDAAALVVRDGRELGEGRIEQRSGALRRWRVDGVGKLRIVGE